MSKSNVHPDHYKVAGRDRQGEDILQARNKQKRAQVLARERFEPRPTTPPTASPARAPKTAASGKRRSVAKGAEGQDP